MLLVGRSILSQSRVVLKWIDVYKQGHLLQWANQMWGRKQEMWHSVEQIYSNNRSRLYLLFCHNCSNCSRNNSVNPVQITYLFFKVLSWKYIRFYWLLCWNGEFKNADWTKHKRFHFSLVLKKFAVLWHIFPNQIDRFQFSTATRINTCICTQAYLFQQTLAKLKTRRSVFNCEEKMFLPYWNIFQSVKSYFVFNKMSSSEHYNKTCVKINNLSKLFKREMCDIWIRMGSVLFAWKITRA